MTTPMKNRMNRSLLIGIILVSIIALTAVISLFWTPYRLDDTSEGFRLGPPSAAHWAGTDKLGRDLFSQLMAGARLAIFVAFSASTVAALFGVSLGLLASISGKFVDEALSRLFDAMIAFPTILLAMLIVTVRGASMESAVFAIGLSASAGIARVTRINAIRVLQSDFAKAARAAGASPLSILFRHVIPNIFPFLLVQLTLVASGAILAEASLAYLGLGAPPPQASWGRMLMEAQSSVLTAPWGAVFPGAAIVVTVMGLNFLGDGIRELIDPEAVKDE